jgi:hypothetical protein
MQLAKLAAKPQLVKIEINDEDTVKKYGESVEFWVYDRYDMDTFMKLATINEENFTEIANVISSMLMDEKGKKIVDDGTVLPMDITTKAVQSVVEYLGNAVSQTLVA